MRLSSDRNTGKLLSMRGGISFSAPLCFTNHRIRQKMELSLNEFEQQVNKTILMRGRDYFEHDHVVRVKRLSEGEFELAVMGTERYTVYLRFWGDAVMDHDCSCPYAWGPVCKHVVASLFYLRENGLYSAPPLSKEMKDDRSVPRQVATMLEEMNYDDLRLFVHTLCWDDSLFQQIFLVRSLQFLPTVSPDLYKLHLRSLINMCNHPTTTPFSYDDIDRVIDAVDDISFSVNDEISLGDPMKAIDISTAIIEEMSAFSCQIEHSEIDDSIERAFNTLERLTHAELTDEQHSKLLDALLSLSYHPALQDEWGRLRAIELAIGIIRNEQERTRVVFALDKMQQAKPPLSHKKALRVQQLKQTLITKLSLTAGHL